MKSNLFIATIIAAFFVIIGVVYFLSPSKQLSAPPNSSKETEVTNTDNALYGHVHALFRVPASGVILLGTHDGLFKSIDQGKTFVKAETGGIVGEFMNFAYDEENKIIFAGGHGLGVVKSTDNAITWTKADSGIKGDDIHALALNSLDPSRIYAFSVDQGVFGTKDGAKSWYRIDDGPSNPSVRSFGYMAAPSPMDRSMRTDTTTNIGYLWAGTGGGLYSSFACFCGWTKNQVFPDTATIYTIAPDPRNRSSMLIGTKGGIYKTTDEGKIFTKIQSDITNVTAITFDASNLNSLLASTESGVLYKSEDGGNTWQKN